MIADLFLYGLAGFAAAYLGYRLVLRLQLSKAKHPSLRGHARMARRMAKALPFYEYGERRFFSADDAPTEVVQQRREAFTRLSQSLRRLAPHTLEAAQGMEETISDVSFISNYRIPFQFRSHVKKHLKLGNLLGASRGTAVCDLDGNWFRDLSGAYGMNVFGYDFYKDCIRRGIERVEDLGPVLGPYHPLVAENARVLCEITGLDEVSFHMSGTEAVMQAVRLARYHTGRSHIVRFCGAYHGWWDGVQAGVGNPRPAREVYTLKDMDPDTLRVLRRRKDIACVLINPLQALHPNNNAPADSTLVASDRSAHFDKEAYGTWLQELREVCSERGIVLIFDDVFMGFRLALGGTQEFFGVKADMVTLGKTLGGGLPIGAVCGTHGLMKRFREDRPADICFARGTFNSHPYVMAAANEFLRRVQASPLAEHYADQEEIWNRRVATLNSRLEREGLPLKMANMMSVWTTLYTQPGRYNWMLQYYLREAGLLVSWVGSGRFIFSHDYSEADYEDFVERFIGAARTMAADGWWRRSGELTNKGIKRRVLGEVLRARFQKRDPA